jgi:hypothetical protein
MAGKLRDLEWRELPRTSQQASLLYPDLASGSIQKGMLDRAATEPQGAGRLRERMGPGARPEPPKNYDRVPGLRRIQPSEAKATKSWWDK